jgi:hypothetical protein
LIVLGEHFVQTAVLHGVALASEGGFEVEAGFFGVFCLGEGQLLLLLLFSLVFKEGACFVSVGGWMWGAEGGCAGEEEPGERDISHYYFGGVHWFEMRCVLCG